MTTNAPRPAPIRKGNLDLVPPPAPPKKRAK